MSEYTIRTNAALMNRWLKATLLMRLKINRGPKAEPIPIRARVPLKERLLQHESYLFKND